MKISESQINDFITIYFPNLRKVYGNCHDTMIGFFVNWWIDTQDSIVIQSTPSLDIDISRLKEKLAKNPSLQKEFSIKKMIKKRIKRKKSIVMKFFVIRKIKLLAYLRLKEQSHCIF